MLVPRKHLLILSVFLCSSLFLYHWEFVYPYLGVVRESLINFNGPANATLGFGAVLAVSALNSPRRSRLIQAANVTELDLTIPEQPRWTEEDVERFNQALSRSDHTTGRGSILAWLSHITVLEWFLDSGLETALILEDDVDWDIHLRTVQVPQAAAAIRSLFPSESGYYGNIDAWDVLWIGHCGDWFQKISDGIGPGFQFPSNLSSLPHKIFEDNTLPDRSSLHPFTKDFLDALEIPEKTRFVHKAILPLCSFGYAVNRASAARIVAEIASVSRPRDSAWDLAIMHGCERRGLRCYTVNPELFHHMVGDSIIAEEDHREAVYLPPVDEKGLAQTKERNETSNIECGFWSGDFFFRTPERLQMLREDVGRKGRCLKPVREKNA